MLAGAPREASAQAAVVVNGERLPPAVVARLQSAGLALPGGRFRNDPASGGWGADGGPSAGQLPPGLALGGPLRADASVRGSGTFINGRELHPIEVQQLALLFNAPVPRLRFWMNAQGIGGPEGGPPTFSLQAATEARRQSHGAGAIRSGPGGTTGSDGRCFYFNDPSTGTSAMTGDC